MSNYKTLTSLDIDKLQSRNRAELINKLSGFKSPVLIGTCGDSCVNNLSIISSLFHIGSNPPLLGFVLRPPGSEYSHTYKNIISSQQFTISNIHSEIVKKAHRCSAKFPGHISEFESVGLTPFVKKITNWIAPAVLESNTRMGLVLNSKIELPNRCVLIVGEIKWIDSTELSFKEEKIHFETNDISVVGLYDYYKSHKLFQLGYEHYEEIQFRSY
jgi:flavin reductase (DIM6/NTAB) family NADH-FMN oxidoreductase RutF